MVRKLDRPYIAIRRAGNRTYFYFRKNGKMVRLPDNPDSLEFDRAYWACRSGKSSKSIKTTFDALIKSYRSSPAFLKLKPRTRQGYEAVLLLISEKNGSKDFCALRRKDVIAARDAYADTWRKANSIVETLSILAKHAIDLEWITSNPATGVEKLKGGSYEPWPQWALDAFEREASGIALTAYHLGVGTGQRLEDLCRMEWDHYDGEGIHVIQGKTGARVWVACPSKLSNYLQTLPRAGRYILAKNPTQGLTKSQVQKAVALVRKAIGAEAYVIHGWRYTAAAQLAEAGCSDSQIQAVTGHRPLEMVQKYRAGANQKRLSREAQSMRNKNGT